MQLLDGKVLSEQILAEIAEEVSAIKAKGDKIPHLAAVLVGTDGASMTYVNSKVKNCEKVDRFPVVKVADMFDDQGANHYSGTNGRSSCLFYAHNLEIHIAKFIPWNLGTQSYPTIAWIQFLWKWAPEPYYYQLLFAHKSRC